MVVGWVSGWARVSARGRVSVGWVGVGGLLVGVWLRVGVGVGGWEVGV